MNLGIDIAVVVIVIVSVIFGFKRGLLSSLISLAGSIASFIGASYLSDIVSRWVYDTFISSRIVSSISDNITQSTDGDSFLNMLENSSLGNFIDMQKATDAIGGFFQGASDLDPSGNAELLANTLVMPSVVSVINIIVFILLLIIFLTLCGIIIKVSDGLNYVPIIGGLNRFFGGVVGVFIGVVICVIIATLVNIIIPLLNSSDLIESWIDNSTVFSIIYYNNPFRMF